MGLVWNPWAVPGLLVLLVCGATAALVYFARPDRVQNRRLALQLALESFVVGVYGGALWIVDDPQVVWALSGVATFLVWPKLWAYYSFLATLPTPLARPLRRPYVLPVFLGLTVLVGLSWFLWPDFYLLGVVAAPFAPWAAVPGSGFFLIMNLWGVMWLVGLTFSLSALHYARTDIQRRQAKAYLTAFGFRDVSFAALTVLLTAIPLTSPAWLYVFMIFPFIWIAYPLLVTYGILRHQLFDIDLKLKFAVKGSTLAAVFVAVFFVVSEAAAALFSARLGPVAGLVAAGGLVFAISPLQRFAERVSSAALPRVEGTPAYVAYRKLEVYRAALEGAWEDGGVSDKERRMLERLRGELQLATEDAAALERDVAAVFRPIPAGGA